MIRTILKRFLHKKSTNLQKRYPEYPIGRGTYSPDLEVLRRKDGAVLKIGAFCSIAAGVKIILGGEHRIDWVTTYPFNVLWDMGKNIKGHPKTKGDVVIGNDVWIGNDAVILSGVKIEDGAVIGARAAVSVDIPPYSIAVGNPVRIVKKRFDEDTIQRLLKIKWWEWNDDRIGKMLPMLLNNDIESFLKAAEGKKHGD